MKELALCFLVLCSVACSLRKMQPSGDTAQGPGTREFKIDESKSAFILSLTGVSSGTPDGEVISSILEMAQNDGTITKSIDLGQPVEGGIHHCIEIHDTGKRHQLLERLQKTQTSMQESNYKIESLATCLQAISKAQD